jgi:hypothetical protein
VLGETADDSDATTHGICDPCAVKLEVDARRSERQRKRKKAVS